MGLLEEVASNSLLFSRVMLQLLFSFFLIKIYTYITLSFLKLIYKFVQLHYLILE